MTRIQVLRPDVAEETRETAPLARRVPISNPAVCTVIDNGKPNARSLLQMVAQQVGTRITLAAVETFCKPTASKPIDADEARMLAARSRLVLTGVGD